MNESEYQALREASWNRALTPAEQAQLNAWLAAHPENQPEWETDEALNRLLHDLPDAPVASNFTAQVLSQLDRADSLADGSSEKSGLNRWLEFLFRPASRVAWALLLAAAIWFGYEQHRSNVREDISTGLSVLANVATLSDPVVLQDFEAIQRLSQARAGEDEELFAVLME